MARSPLDDVLQLGVRGLGAIGKIGPTCAAHCPFRLGRRGPAMRGLQFVDQKTPTLIGITPSRRDTARYHSRSKTTDT